MQACLLHVVEAAVGAFRQTADLVTRVPLSARFHNCRLMRRRPSRRLAAVAVVRLRAPLRTRKLFHIVAVGSCLPSWRWHLCDARTAAVVLCPCSCRSEHDPFLAVDGNVCRGHHRRPGPAVDGLHWRPCAESIWPSTPVHRVDEHLRRRRHHHAYVPARGHHRLRDRGDDLVFCVLHRRRGAGRDFVARGVVHMPAYYPIFYA
jgi:hypothetical protein